MLIMQHKCQFLNIGGVKKHTYPESAPKYKVPAPFCPPLETVSQLFFMPYPDWQLIP